MKTYLISYDLLKPGQDYSDLYAEIKSLADGWWHNLQSVWLVNTNLNAGQIRDRLTNQIDANDKILVVDLGGNWATFNIPKAGNDWLHTQAHFVYA